MFFSLKRALDDEEGGMGWLGEGEGWGWGWGMGDGRWEVGSGSARNLEITGHNMAHLDEVILPLCSPRPGADIYLGKPGFRHR